MIKVSLLLQDKGISDLDLTDLSGGNPGLGGTEYLFVLLLFYLASYENDIDVTVYHFNNNKLPTKKAVLISSEEEAFSKAASEGNNIFVMKNLQDKAVYDLFAKYQLKYIMWCHNYLTLDEMKFFDKSKSVSRVIAVGRQMYDYYVDHNVIQKMDYVFNLFEPAKKNRIRKNNYSNNVTYVGSLIYQKSFHVLAGAWKKIAAEVPDARLNVIGTGKLYDRNNRLGRLGVAEESYEEMFLKDLTNDSGNLLDSVTFHGLMGDEKFDVYEDTAVGVVNPLASTETFCLCAIEMEASGIPVVSRRKNGLLDTIKDGQTGLLYSDASQLADYVIKLLKDRKLNDELSKEAIKFAKEAFLPEKVMPEWIRVFKEVDGNRKAKYKKPSDYFDNNGKKVRMLIHAIHAIPLFRWVPSIHDIQKK